MTTYTIANAFRPELDSAVDGLTVEAYKVSTWSGAHNPPHLGDSPPGSPAVSGTTSTNFGNHGAWELALPTNEDYFVVVEYSSSYYWSRYNLPAFTDGEIGEVDTGAMTIAEVVAGGLYTDPDLAYIQPVGATSSGSVSDGAVIHGAFIDHQHAGLGQSLQLTGATEPTRYAGATTIGAPSSGTFSVGDFVVDQSGQFWIYDSSDTWVAVGAASTGDPGDIKVYAGLNPPAGWLACNGSSVSETTYPDLFSALTTTLSGSLTNGSTTISGLTTGETAALAVGWGIASAHLPTGTTIASIASTSITVTNAATATESSETLTIAPWGISGTTSPFLFALPDLRGRVLMGSGQGSRLSDRQLATIGGEEEHTLTLSEIPSHDHGFGDASQAPSTTNVLSYGTNTMPPMYSIANAIGEWPSSGYINSVVAAGGGGAHNNVQPFGVVNFAIKY